MFLISNFSEQLGAAMIEGLAAAWDGPRAQIFERGVAGLRRRVPCDGAWWGLVEASPNVAVAPCFHVAGSIGLSDDFRQSFVEICSDDEFAAAVLASPEQVLRWSGPAVEVPSTVRAWAARHRLAHGAAVSSYEPFIGQISFVALYRFEGGVAFSDDEATLMRLLVEQLVVLWRRSLQDMFSAASAESLAGTLLAKSDGTLVFCGAAMASRLITVGWDQQGQRAPAPLLQFGGAGGRVRMGDDWVVISEDGEGLRAELASTGRVPPLPTRVLRVAALFCDGLTAKQIARKLELSPATVRTYLRDAYHQLGVRNKLELHSAMRRGRPQVRI